MIMVTLAGCSDDGPAKEGETEESGNFKEVEVTDELGAITGVVVDPSIQTVAGASVTLPGHGLNTTTDSEGRFAFADLEPGLYFVEADGEGFGAVQAQAEVLAGEATKVQIVVQVDPSEVGYLQTIPFAWFDSMGQGFVDFAIDLTSRTFLGGAVPAQCDECYFTFESSGPVETYVIEAVWEDSIGSPLGATSYFYTFGEEGNLPNTESDYWQSPGRAVFTDNHWGQVTTMEFAMAADEGWIHMNQKAEMYATAFYNVAAPEGWSFVGA